MKQLSQNWYLYGNANPRHVRNIRSSIITSHCLILIMHLRHSSTLLQKSRIHPPQKIKKNYNLPLISTTIIIHLMIIKED